MAFTSQFGTVDAVAGLTLQAGLGAGLPITRNVSETIFTDSVEIVTFFANAANRIFFFGAFPGPLGGPSGEIGQEATHNYVFVDVAQTFLTDSGGYNQERDVIQYIGFTTRKLADAKNELFTAAAANAAYIATVVNASNTFSFNAHDATPFDALKRTYPATNSLGFMELTTIGTFDDIYDTITMDTTLDTVGTEHGGNPNDSGWIKQAVTFQITGKSCPEKEYTPFIGDSDDTTYPAVSATAPTLGKGVLTLTHPRVSPTLTLVLKNPEFGNSDVLRFAKVDRVTRGGDRKIFSDLGWGSTQSFELTVTNICNTTVTIDNILDFLNTSLGEEIGLLDWENRQWKGLIVAPETEVTPTVSGHSVRIVFEGELV